MNIYFSFLAAALVALLFSRLYRRIYRNRKANVLDAIAFLVPVDYDQLEALLDAQDERNLREHLRPREFREAQQKRMRLFLELLRRMTANAYLLLELGRHDIQRGRKAAELEWIKLGAELENSALDFISIAVNIRITLHASLIKSVFLPFSETANISSLRRFGEFDLFQGYQKMVDAALNLSHAYGDDIHQKLVEAL